MHNKHLEFLQAQIDIISIALAETGSINEKLLEQVAQARDRTQHRLELQAASIERKGLLKRIEELEAKHPELYL